MMKVVHSYTAVLKKNSERLHEPVRILISLFQIQALCMRNFELIWPTNFAKLSSKLFVVNLDVLDMLGCHLASTNHVDRMIAQTSFSLCLLVLMISAGSCKWAGKGTKTIIWQFMFLFLFLIYPGTSSCILQMFSFKTLPNDSKWLEVDLSIQAYSRTSKGIVHLCTKSLCGPVRSTWFGEVFGYDIYHWYSVFMVLVFPVGIPVFLFHSLYSSRHTLYDKKGNIDREGRYGSVNKSCSHLRGVYFSYQPRYVYWEIFEFFRKLWLGAMIVFVSPGTITQFAIACIASLGSIVIYEVCNPYRSPASALLQLACNTQLFFIFFTGLLIEAQQDSLVEGLDRLLVAGVCICAVIALSSVLIPERKRVLAKLTTFMKPHVDRYRSAIHPTEKTALTRKPPSKLPIDHALQTNPRMTPPPRRLPPLLDSSNTSVPQPVWDRINDASLKLDLSRISALCDETNSAAAELQDSLASVDELDSTDRETKRDEHRKASFPSGNSKLARKPIQKEPLVQKNRIVPTNSRATISGPSRTAALVAHSSSMNTAGASDGPDLNSGAVDIEAVHRDNSECAAMSRLSDRGTGHFECQTDAAIRIQCFFRHHFAFQVTQTLLTERKLRQPVVAQAWSPTSISSPVTSVRAEQAMAAVTLQAWWRMIKVRLWMAYWQFCKETMAAVKIQSWSRMMIAMRALVLRRRERRVSLPIEI
jgi:hypothetical protein